jgi:hypothetical protein
MLNWQTLNGEPPKPPEIISVDLNSLQATEPIPIFKKALERKAVIEVFVSTVGIATGSAFEKLS